MKKLFLLTVSIWTTLLSFSQLKIALDSFSYKYRIDTLYSDSLKETRTIKIFIPDDFKKENKYPVFFVLDEDWMFEPTITNVKQLVNGNIIPQSIVVGIHSENRSQDLRLGLDGNFTQKSLNFYNFINSELFDYLSKNITTPAFPILIGHSDGAVFSEKVLAQEKRKFRAIISLSPQLDKGQFEEIKKFTDCKFSKIQYHFVAGGIKDSPNRLKSAIKLDSLFKTIKNSSVKVESKIYNIDHFAVATRGLVDGISFIFKDFVEDNDWNDQFLDSLKKLKINPLEYLKSFKAKINEIYNLDFKPRKEGALSVASFLIENKQQLREYWDYEISLYGKNNDYYAFYAQNLERLNEFDEALKYWIINLNDSNSKKESFFYLRRPIELIAYKLNKPKQALKFIDEWQKRRNKYPLQFNFWFAKICAEKNIEKNKGKMAIKYCIDNYNSSILQIETLKKLEVLLNK